MKGFTEQHLKDYLARHPHDPRLADALARAALAPPRKQGRKGQRCGQEAETALSQSLALLGIPHETEYEWGKELTPPRRFRSDVAIPECRLLCEIDGQVHSIRSKREGDIARQNAGVMAGWAFLRFTPAQARDGSAAVQVAEFLQQKQEERKWPT